MSLYLMRKAGWWCFSFVIFRSFLMVLHSWSNHLSTFCLLTGFHVCFMRSAFYLMAKISFIPHQDPSRCSALVYVFFFFFNFTEGTMTSLYPGGQQISEQIILTPCFCQYNYINVFDRFHEFRVSALQLRGWGVETLKIPTAKYEMSALKTTKIYQKYIINIKS